MAWPERRIVTLPDNMSDAEGALLEPLGGALHAVSLAGGLRPGASVGVENRNGALAGAVQSGPGFITRGAWPGPSGSLLLASCP